MKYFRLLINLQTFDLIFLFGYRHDTGNNCVEPWDLLRNKAQIAYFVLLKNSTSTLAHIKIQSSNPLFLVNFLLYFVVGGKITHCEDPMTLIWLRSFLSCYSVHLGRTLPISTHFCQNQWFRHIQNGQITDEKFIYDNFFWNLGDVIKIWMDFTSVILRISISTERTFYWIYNS